MSQFENFLMKNGVNEITQNIRPTPVAIKLFTLVTYVCS